MKLSGVWRRPGGLGFDALLALWQGRSSRGMSGSVTPSSESSIIRSQPLQKQVVNLAQRWIGQDHRCQLRESGAGPG